MAKDSIQALKSTNTCINDLMRHAKVIEKYVQNDKQLLKDDLLQKGVSYWKSALECALERSNTKDQIIKTLREYFFCEKDYVRNEYVQCLLMATVHVLHYRAYEAEFQRAPFFLYGMSIDTNDPSVAQSFLSGELQKQTFINAMKIYDDLLEKARVQKNVIVLIE